MSKVFGYSRSGGKNWFASDSYSDKEIEAIKDPEGGSEITLPTAIPSPFARMDLVKTAFRNIAKTPSLKAYNTDGIVIASSEDEKLVSDCLDLAEMLFIIDSLEHKPNFIIWDKEVELKKLKQGSEEHKRLGETLELYLDQDKESYNFDSLRKIFLIEYNHKIIGGTSPVTMFFTTANDLSDAQIKLTMNDFAFDNNYASLYERDAEFQKYLHHLLKANKFLTSKMCELANYLEKNVKILNTKNKQLYSEINKQIPEDFYKLYAELNTGTANNDVEVLGVGLRKRKSEDIINYVSNNSEFRINSSKVVGENKPLVLQNDFSKEWIYAKDIWKNFKVPYFENAILSKRRLPEINITYPYLTISDFLEPYLIRLVYPINKEKFYDGSLLIETGDDTKGYLLPLKPKFFEYFNSQDLLTNLPEKPKIELIQGVAKSVKVSLKIPVTKKGEYISFERIYKDSPGVMNEQLNHGEILEHQFGITIFPFIKINIPKVKPFYRIQLVDRDIAGDLKMANYDLKFYSNNIVETELSAISKLRSNKQIHSASSKYFVLNHEFDFIQVKSQFANGIVIPKWKLYEAGNKEFKFAIDFGTTNTHIEYNDTSNPNRSEE